MPAMIAGMTTAIILVLLGVKMLGSDFFQVRVPVSLGAVVGILAIAAIASFISPPKGSHFRMNREVENGR